MALIRLISQAIGFFAQVENTDIPLASLINSLAAKEH